MSNYLEKQATATCDVCKAYYGRWEYETGLFDCKPCVASSGIWARCDNCEVDADGVPSDCTSCGFTEDTGDDAELVDKLYEVLGGNPVH